MTGSTLHLQLVRVERHVVSFGSSSSSRGGRRRRRVTGHELCSRADAVKFAECLRVLLQLQPRIGCKCIKQRFGFYWDFTCKCGARVDVVLREAVPALCVTTLRAEQHVEHLLLSRFTACTTSSNCATDSVRSARALSASRLATASSEEEEEESRVSRTRRGSKDDNWGGALR
jgi:hypothetical protein